MNKYTLSISTLLAFSILSIGVLQSCGENKDKEDASKNIFLQVAAAQSNLPTCNSDREGLAVYVEADSNFRYCKSNTWTVLNISSGSGTSVSNSGGSNIGSLLYGDAAELYVKVSDGSVIVMNVGTGGYTGGICTTRSGCIRSGSISDAVQEDAQCFYTTTNCSGNCLAIYKPLANMVFMSSGPAYFKASGTESSSGFTTVRSFWDAYNQSCSTMGASNLDNSWPITTSYTFPTGFPSYPFSTPITFQ